MNLRRLRGSSPSAKASCPSPTISSRTPSSIRPPGTTVTVGVDVKPDSVDFSVVDSGPGIPQELRERVFDRFYRAPDQTQSGSGLGLAIVRSVAERHGATVNLVDRDHQAGLHVRVRFARAANN